MISLVFLRQESNAEKALDALKKLQPDESTVLRDGRWQTIEAVQLVPGDICEVRVGDKVPADLLRREVEDNHHSHRAVPAHWRVPERPEGRGEGGGGCDSGEDEHALCVHHGVQRTMPRHRL